MNCDVYSKRVTYCLHRIRTTWITPSFFCMFYRGKMLLHAWLLQQCCLGHLSKTVSDASKNRCWMADRLGRRGLPCPAACPLCGQEPETLQHLLFGCLVARENIKAEYDWWRLAKLFRGTSFSFPDPLDLPWQAGEVGFGGSRHLLVGATNFAFFGFLLCD